MRDFTVRKVTLKRADQVNNLSGQSPGQLIGMMWRLALDAWSFNEKSSAEPRLQKHVVIIRNLKD